jgi:hypothetical protein
MGFSVEDWPRGQGMEGTVKTSMNKVNSKIIGSSFRNY